MPGVLNVLLGMRGANAGAVATLVLDPSTDGDFSGYSSSVEGETLLNDFGTLTPDDWPLGSGVIIAIRSGFEADPNDFGLQLIVTGTKAADAFSKIRTAVQIGGGESSHVEYFSDDATHTTGFEGSIPVTRWEWASPHRFAATPGGEIYNIHFFA